MAKDNQIKVKPRKLGDEWETWNGNFEANGGDSQASPILFLFLMFSINIMFLTFLLITYFLLKDVLYNMNHFLYFVFNWIVISLLIIGLLYPILFALSLRAKKPVAFFMKDKQISNILLAKLALSLGVSLKIPKDKVLHSMLRVNNILTQAIHSKIKRDELLILAPRCLAKSIRDDIKEIVDKKGLKFSIASGGSEAREILKGTKPKGIIAIACERDLYAGINDVPPQIPVIAIANKRPEGPCRNTLIDTEELEEIVHSFTLK